MRFEKLKSIDRQINSPHHELSCHPEDLDISIREGKDIIVKNQHTKYPILPNLSEAKFDRFSPTVQNRNKRREKIM